MAITLDASNVARRGFVANGNTTDLSHGEVLVSGVTGKSIYIERVAVSFGAAIAVTLGDGESSSDLATVLIGPIYGAENSTVELVFTRPIMLSAASDLVADADGAGAVTVIVQGYIE